MSPRNKTLSRKFIVHTKSEKTNKLMNNSKLINAITVTKEKNTIHSRVESSVAYGLTYGVFIHSKMVM